jgi:nitrogen regulatory protein PII
MKSIFITYDQAYNMEIADAMEEIGVRGFTMWQDIAGRGSETGEPHLGNHAWPTMNNAILTFVPDDKVDDILAMVRAKDEDTPALGLRAFVWNIEKSY